MTFGLTFAASTFLDALIAFIRSARSSSAFSKTLTKYSLARVTASSGASKSSSCSAASTQRRVLSSLSSMIVKRASIVRELVIWLVLDLFVCSQWLTDLGPNCSVVDRRNLQWNLVWDFYPSGLSGSVRPKTPAKWAFLTLLTDLTEKNG
jgi:hypothetical protein